MCRIFVLSFFSCMPLGAEIGIIGLITPAVYVSIHLFIRSVALLCIHPAELPCHSVGRTPAWNAVCHGFESHPGHSLKIQCTCILTALGVYLCLAL